MSEESGTPILVGDPRCQHCGERLVSGDDIRWLTVGSRQQFWHTACFGVSLRPEPITIPMTPAMVDDAMRFGGAMDHPPPPEPRITRWRRRIRQAYWGARWRLAEIVAGQPIGSDEDD